jgi:hypothetical protein
MKKNENSLLTLEANCGFLCAGLAQIDFQGKVGLNCSLFAQQISVVSFVQQQPENP